MDLHLTLLSILEGIIEFLPISSTAHLIIASKIFSIDTTDAFIKFYLLIIQFGALFAGIVLFTKKIFSDNRIFINVCISFIPSAIVGFVFYKLFKKLLEGNMVILAIMSFIGGLIFIYLEKVFVPKYHHSSLKSFGKKNITKFDAFIIGVAQAVAIIPGVSRSGATIIAGIFRGINKVTIIEYTFMLALPTLGAAVAYDAYKSRDLLNHLHSYDQLFYGLLVSFMVSFIILSFLRRSIEKISLTAFGWYRIILAIIVVFTVFNNTSANVFENKRVKELPIIETLPNEIYPGDPLMIIINASSSVSNIKFDNKDISYFNYKNKPHSFVAISFEEKILDHNIEVRLNNGMIVAKTVTLTPRIVEERPLGIPEKLGGNTQTASKALISNLSIENASLNSIKSSPSILWSESFQAPLKSLIITDTYGYSRNTVGTNILHKGTDFRAAIGTPVFSMNKGIVKAAKRYTVYGNTVVIDHGLGISTLYMHLSKMDVKVGDQVEVGQQIGLSGDTGYAESPHLHISVRINGISIDPVIFMKFFGVL